MKVREMSKREKERGGLNQEEDIGVLNNSIEISIFSFTVTSESKYSRR